MEKIIRMRIPTSLYKKYNILCIKNDLSVPKQTAELIRKFVEIQEENQKIIEYSNNDKKT